MSHREDLEIWAKKWDEAQAKWKAEAQQAPPQPQKSDNFFGLQNNPVPENAPLTKQQGDDWWSIYARSGEIRDENPQPQEQQMFQEEAQGWRKLLGVPQKQKPQQAQRPQGPLSFQEQAEGWRKMLTPPGKGVTFQQHPQHQMSIGMDQGKSPYEPTRVAPNFTDGQELRELSDLKVKLEKLESTLLSGEIKVGRSNVPPSDYKTQLDVLRKKIDQLSDKLTPRPGEDVY